MVEFGCHYRRIHAQMSMKIISRELLFSYYGKPKMVPNKVVFTKGVGVHKERLASFELALRAAGVAHRNLVLVSSIYFCCWQQRWTVDDCVRGSNLYQRR